MGTKTNLQYYLNRFFVPYDYLRILFPQITGKKWLVPFYEVYRWIYHAKNSRTPIIKAEFQAIDQHKKQDADRINDLFEGLKI